MERKNAIAVAAAALLFSAGAQAQITTGSEFIRECQHVERHDAGDRRASADSMAMCYGYLVGFTNGVDVATAWYQVHAGAPASAALFCIPTAATPDQFMRIGLKFMRENPARLHESSAILLGTALRQAFPCAPR